VLLIDEMDKLDHAFETMLLKLSSVWRLSIFPTWNCVRKEQRLGRVFYARFAHGRENISFVEV
jgi:hypothetical protein